MCENLIVSDQEYKNEGYKLFSGDYKHMENSWTAKARFRPDLDQNRNKVTDSLVDSIDKAFFKYTVRKHNIPGRIKKEGNSWLVIRNDKREKIEEKCEKIGIPIDLVIKDSIPEEGAYIKKIDKEDFDKWIIINKKEGELGGPQNIGGIININV